MSLLPVGSLAPEFDLAAHDGTRVRLSELAGSYVLLWFYPEADTPG
jgi:peroxiredoxin Q/BCP